MLLICIEHQVGVVWSTLHNILFHRCKCWRESACRAKLVPSEYFITKIVPCIYLTIVMQSEKTLRYDVSTCFDFLFWEIKEQQLAKRTKVCSFDSFSGKYRNKNWSKSFSWCNSNFSGFDFVFMEKYDLFPREISWDLQAQTCPLKCHLKPRLDESELLFLFLEWTRLTVWRLGENPKSR